MEFLSPAFFPDYELIDSGNFEKLERFGKYVTIRPEPQAVWAKGLHENEWEQKAHVKFVPKSSSSGSWNKMKEMPDRWHISYPLGTHELKFRLALTSFKHVGIFPEQAVNWDFIYRAVSDLNVAAPRVLNLFAYTGGASIAARAAGADVTHLDAIKQVVSWARENMELSGLQDIRWLIEDAMTYVRRELRRGKTYQGIILDPPAYGHGPDGQRWKLEDHILELVNSVVQLLDPEKYFLVLNTYSLGFSPIILDNMLSQTFLKGHYSCGEIYLPSSTGLKLPLGVFARALKSQ